MSDPDESTPAAPIEDLAALRARLKDAYEFDPGTAVIGGFLLAMLAGMPFALWWGTEAGLLSAFISALGWVFVMAFGLIIIGTVAGDKKTNAVAARTLIAATLIAGGGWFAYYGEGGWMLPAILAAIGPIGGLLGWRDAIRKTAALRVDPPLGLSPETFAACKALPESLAEPLDGILDRAIADVQALDRLASNGMLDDAGQSSRALRGDVDRAVRTLARRALVGDTMIRRSDAGEAEPVIDGMRRIAEELHNLTDAALLAAASAEGTADSLAEHISNLRLTTAGQAEIEEAVAGA